MSRASYGNTWWGEQWPQALAQIDYDSRLPRGRAYANRGAVRDLKVHEGHVRAHVPQVDAADAARLAERLAADPGVIARLLNRELDPAVLKEAQALDIQVFPRRWKDSQMECSCPDWAVPCKHLAAVIYLLSREGDADPYLVFKLRGIDLQTLLGRHGEAVDAQAERALPAGALALFEDDPERATLEPTHDPQALARMDFTAVPELCEPLWRLLPAQPVFHHGGDFRELAHRTVARIAREAQRQLDAAAAAVDAGSEAASLPEGQLRLRVNAQAAAKIAGATLDGRALDTLPGLLAALAAVPSQSLPELGTDFAAMHTLHLLALHFRAGRGRRALDARGTGAAGRRHRPTRVPPAHERVQDSGDAGPAASRLRALQRGPSALGAENEIAARVPQAIERTTSGPNNGPGVNLRIGRVRDYRGKARYRSGRLFAWDRR